MNEQAKHLIELVNKKSKEINNKFISITSGKGGVGKTNFAVNFSYILANKFGKKVLLIDADIGMADVHVVLNIKPENTLKNIINGKKPSDVVIKTKGIDILPGFSGIDSIDELEDFLFMKLIQDLSEFSENYDYVVIDTAAGIDSKVSSFIRAASKSYVITTPEPTALMDAYALIKSIYNLYQYSDFKLIINMCKNKNEALNTYERLNNSFKKFLDKSFEFQGWIPFSKNLPLTIKQKKLISEEYPSDDFVKNIAYIAAKETQEELTEEKGNFWEKLLNLLKKQ